MPQPLPTIETGWARTMAWSVVLLRLIVIAGSALAALDFDGEIRLRLLLATTLFAMCSLLLGALASVRPAPADAVGFWIDTGWILALFALSGGATVYYLPLYVPILLAGFRGAFRQTVALAVVAAVASFIVLFVLLDVSDWLHTLPRPLALLLFGPVATTAALAGARPREVAAFAADLLSRIDSRNGLPRSVSALIQPVGTRFDADTALLAFRPHDGSTRVFWWSRGEAAAELPTAASIAEEMFRVQVGLVVPAARAPEAAGRALAELVERRHLMIAAPNTGSGFGVRLLLGRDSQSFGMAALRSVHYVLDRISPVLENAALLEQLATDAAETERARIGRDLHDSAIQPYIGLKLAVEALARRIPPHDPIAADVHRLLAMTQQEVAKMRGVVKDIRARIGDDMPIDAAIRAQVKRYAELFDFHVDVAIDCSAGVGRTLAAELPHMVCEALSNVRRHTRSRSASVRVSSEINMLVLAVRNALTAGERPPAPFTPKSLAERAAALGGYTSVQTDNAGTIVTVRVPLD
jgi:signal transduction histidine kinase